METLPTCPSGHALVEFFPHVEITCRECGEAKAKGSTLWGCGTCPWCMCTRCHRSQRSVNVTCMVHTKEPLVASLSNTRSTPCFECKAPLEGGRGTILYTCSRCGEYNLCFDCHKEKSMAKYQKGTEITGKYCAIDPPAASWRRRFLTTREPPVHPPPKHPWLQPLPDYVHEESQPDLITGHTPKLLECQICTEYVKNRVLGCGHTICSVCLKDPKLNKCPYCKKPIQSVSNFYL